MSANTAASKSAKNTEPLNILFTCAGRRVALLQAFRDALAELGVAGELLATDITDAAPAYHRADRGFLVPAVRSIDYTPRLKQIVADNDVRLIVPLTDLDLRVLSRHADEYAAMGCAVMVAPEETLKACRNKIEFDKLLRKAGMQGIETMSLASFRKKPFFPCFVKPIYGSAGIGTRKVASEEELDLHVQAFGKQLMVQEYLPGREFTVDVYRRRDGVVCAVVPRQRLSVRSGEVEKGVTIYDPTLIEQALTLAQHLPGMWGVFNAQCRWPDGGGPRFFEINPRFGGGAPLSIAAGVHLPKLLLMELLGMDVPEAVGQFTRNLLMLRYDDAHFVQVDDPKTLPGYNQPTIK